jgi:hypothetical protein
MFIRPYFLLKTCRPTLDGERACGNGTYNRKLNFFCGWQRITKFLTWKNLQQRGWEGPGRCQLCKEDSEDIDHLFFIVLSPNSSGRKSNPLKILFRIGAGVI